MTQNREEISREVHMLHADFCSALADERRLLLIYTLAQGPKRVHELTRTLAISQPSVSRHLKLLRERGLVRAERRGRAVIYALSDDRLVAALDTLRAVMRDQWAHRAQLMRGKLREANSEPPSQLRPAAPTHEAKA